MSKLQLLTDFVNERLALAALEIMRLFEQTLAECQEEMRLSWEKRAELQRMLDIQPQIKLHLTDVQQFSPPQIKEEHDLWSSQGAEQHRRLQSDTTDSISSSPSDLDDSAQLPALDQFLPSSTDVQRPSLPASPQIKEEEDLWTSQGAEQLQGLRSEGTDSLFTSPRVRSHCEPEDSSQLLLLDQNRPVEIRVKASSTTNTSKVTIKVECDEEDYGEPEAASDFQPSVMPDCPTAQSLDGERGLLPELPSYSLTLPSTRVLKPPTESRKTQVECSRPTPSSSWSSPGPSQRAETSSNHWTRPIARSSSGSKVVTSLEAGGKTVQKPFVCGKCNKGFNENGQLARHRRTHAGEKPFKCDRCEKAFRFKGDLVRHRRTHTGEKPYKCGNCDKAFSQKCDYDRHIRTHTGEKPFKCEKCGKAFGRQGDLLRHRRTHTGEKPFQCPECGKSFIQSGNLHVHRKIHRKEAMAEESNTTFSYASGCDNL